MHTHTHSTRAHISNGRTHVTSNMCNVTQHTEPPCTEAARAQMRDQLHGFIDKVSVDAAGTARVTVLCVNDSVYLSTI